MLSKDDIKDAFKEVIEGSDNDLVTDTARKIVNIERKSYYGDKNNTKRLKEIRELLNKSADMEN